MARLLNGTTHQHLNCQTGTAVPYPLTFAFRLKLSASSPSGIPVTYGEAVPQWDADYTGASFGGFSAVSGKGASFFGTTAVGAPVVGQWHLFVAVWTSASERRVYFDGSAATVVDTNPVPPVGHAAKNFTLGGVLVGAATIHTPAGMNAEIADVGFWDTALMPADVDKLKNGRPGDVKSGNLIAWWKLGEDGSLANSAGAYGPMVEYGSCPVTPDPVYHSPYEKNALIYAPPRISRAFDADAPFRQDLCFAATMAPPFTDETQAWNYRSGHGALSNSSPTGLLLAGEDNSFRNPALHNNHVELNTGFSNPWSGGAVLSCWAKFYSFPDTNGNLLTPAAFYQGYDIYGYWESWGVFTDGAAPYGYQRRMSYTRVHLYGYHGGPESPVQVPHNEWVHLALSLDLNGSLATGGYINYYQNGKLVGSTYNSLRADFPSTQSRAFIGHSSALGAPSPDCALKDFRQYGRYFNAEEMRTLYEHSFEFHKATSGGGLINTATRPVRVQPRFQEISRAPALARALGLTVLPGALLRNIGAARRTAFAKGVGLVPGAFTKSIARALKPATAKGVAPQGGIIATALARAQAVARAGGMGLVLPPVLTAWARAQAPAFAKGITSTPGLAVAFVSHVRALARAAGLKPQGGLISQLIARAQAVARVSGITALLRDFSFHGSLTRMNSTQPWASIERERRTLLGADSRLELMTMAGSNWVLALELSTHWVARRARFLGTADEWLLEIPEETLGKFQAVKDLAGARIYTHGQTLTFRITQTNRPLKAGHVWEFQLEAIGDRT
jgi:hypothetical protein